MEYMFQSSGGWENLPLQPGLDPGGLRSCVTGTQSGKTANIASSSTKDVYGYIDTVNRGKNEVRVRMSQPISPSAQKVQDALAALGLPCQVAELPQTTRNAVEA